MPEKAMITERALLTRINRQLIKEMQQVRKCRINTSGHGELGDFYAVDLNCNTVTAKHVDLETWGRELGVLAGFEAVR